MHIIGILAPVLLLVTLGWLLVRFRFLDDGFFRGCAKLTYWIGLPALLLNTIANARVDYAASWQISLVMIGATLAVAAIAAITGTAAVPDPGRRKTFIHTSFHSNTSFVGLPVILYALGSRGAYAGLVDVATIAVAPIIPFVNILSIIVMGTVGPGASLRTLLRSTGKAVINPTVLACLLGLALSSAGIELPSALSRGLESLGRMALPLALLSIGAGLTFHDLRGSLSLTVTAALLNVLLLPLFGYVGSRLLGLTGEQTLIALIFLACPTAAAAFIYAREMHGDHRFAGNVIVLSTVLSTISLWLVLYLYLQRPAL